MRLRERYCFTSPLAVSCGRVATGYVFLTAITRATLLMASCRVTHCNDVIMSAMASQITNHAIVNSTVYSRTDQGKYQSSASLAFVRGIHRSPVNSPHKWPVTRKMIQFDDVMMCHSFGDRLPTNFTYGYSIFEWVAETPLQDNVPGQLP